jgi:hypothetical protein
VGGLRQETMKRDTTRRVWVVVISFKLGIPNKLLIWGGSSRNTNVRRVPGTVFFQFLIFRAVPFCVALNDQRGVYICLLNAFAFGL